VTNVRKTITLAIEAACAYVAGIEVQIQMSGSLAAFNVTASLLKFLQLRRASMLASRERLRLWPPGALSEDTAACSLKFSHRRT
jgi:hypothetical protein